MSIFKGWCLVWILCKWWSLCHYSARSVLWLAWLASFSRHSERIWTFLEFTCAVWIIQSSCKLWIALYSIKSRFNSNRIYKVVAIVHILDLGSTLTTEHFVVPCTGGWISGLMVTIQTAFSLLSSIWQTFHPILCFCRIAISWIQGCIHYPIRCNLCLFGNEISAQKFRVDVLCGLETPTSLWWDDWFCKLTL